MQEMTSRERFARIFAHQEADRIPIIDIPWNATIERWYREGMPQNMSFIDFFGLDHIGHVTLDNSPRYAEKVLEETETTKTYTTKWGATLREWKHAASTPEFLDFTITNPDNWHKAKARMLPTPDRIPWKRLKRDYKMWQEKGYWIQGNLWFGFDITHSWTVGTERVLLALVENPEWLIDMFNHQLNVNLQLLEMVWETGIKVDSISWPDDMGYKQNQFFSVQMYRDILKPVHQRAINWAHQRGVKAHLHSCGDIRPFIPELIEIGLDGLNPLEVKAGMEPLALKEKYGDKLVLHGGINAVLWDQPEAIQTEMTQLIPKMKAGGGYIFSSDHSVPSSVSLKDFRQIVALAKKLGTYTA